MTKFVRHIDDKGRTYIIEGTEKANHVFVIKQFICEVQEQETQEETAKLAKMILQKLNA